VCVFTCSVRSPLCRCVECVCVCVCVCRVCVCVCSPVLCALLFAGVCVCVCVCVCSPVLYALLFAGVCVCVCRVCVCVCSPVLCTLLFAGVCVCVCVHLFCALSSLQECVCVCRPVTLFSPSSETFPRSAEPSLRLLDGLQEQTRQKETLVMTRFRRIMNLDSLDIVVSGTRRKSPALRSARLILIHTDPL